MSELIVGRLWHDKVSRKSSVFDLHILGFSKTLRTKFFLAKYPGESFVWIRFLSFLQENRVGDLASLAGVLIPLVGFGVTMANVLGSRRAAERAESAARAARESIRLFEVVVNFAEAISILEEIRRAHRQQQWHLLPDRYAAIRKLLISLRTSSTSLTDAQRAVIQEALANLTSIEKTVEKELQNPSSLKPARFNSILSGDIDRLTVVLAELKATKAGV